MSGHPYLLPIPQGMQSKGVHTVRKDLRKGPPHPLLGFKQTFPTCLPLPPGVPAPLAWRGKRAWSSGHAPAHPLGRAAPPGPLLHLTFPSEAGHEKAYVPACGWVRLAGPGLSIVQSHPSPSSRTPVLSGKDPRLRSARKAFNQSYNLLANSCQHSLAQPCTAPPSAPTGLPQSATAKAKVHRLQFSSFIGN